jgi:AraC-like DNA-binding protein
MGRETALAALGRTALDAAESKGVDADLLLQRVRLTRAELDEFDGRIPVDALLALWEAAAVASGDPCFGLHAGEHFVEAKTIHVVGYSARNSPTLGECYARTVKFARLTNEGSLLELERDGSEARLFLNSAKGLPPWPRVYSEMAMAAYLSIGRSWTKTKIQVVRAAFHHAQPDDISEYMRLFGSNVSFSAPRNELILPAVALDLPLKEPDPALQEYLDARATALLGGLGQDREFEERVRTLIDEELANGAPDVETVARRLGMSRRTLQRRLRDHGLSFKKLADDVCKTTALALIANPRFSISAIAALSGYLDSKSFRAAFSRWTGQTPRDYRRRLLADPEPVTR